MTHNPKSTKDAPPGSPARDAPPAPEMAPFTAFATLYQKGVEGLAELQKSKLDLIANQTNEAIAAWKTGVRRASGGAGMFLWDLAGSGISKMAQAEKDMIDLAVEQSSSALEISKQRRDSPAKWTTGAAEMVSNAADRAVAAHKILADFAAEQNKAVAAAVKRQVGVAGSAPAAAAVDTVQRNVEMVIETQKELMEAATKPLKAAAKQAA